MFAFDNNNSNRISVLSGSNGSLIQYCTMESV